MKIKKGAIRKLISIFSSFLILINSFTPYLLVAPILSPVGAQEEISPTSTIEATLEPTITPTVDATVTPTVEVSPTIEVTPIEEISPTVEPTRQPTEAPSVPSPPSTSIVSTEAVSPTPSSDLQTQAPETTPTPEVLALETKIGQVETQIVETYSCRSDSLNGCGLTTDKPDYAPTEVAVITGYGFLSTTIYTIGVSSTDEPAVNFEKEITTDSNGSFTYSYQLDGNYRPNYLVELRDSNGTIVATTTFTDAAKTASVSGNWSNTATWGGSAVPTSSDTVTINSGITVTVDTAAAATSITYAATTASSSITISGTNTLTVSGAISMTRPAAGFTETLAVGAGAVSAGSLSMAATTIASGTRTDIVTISTGTLTVTGAVTLSGTTGDVFTFTDAGTLFMGGTVSAGPPTLTPSTGTVNYNGVAQTAWVKTYNNLTLSGSGAKTFAATPTVNGILSMEGTATVIVTGVGVVTYGTNATLQYNTSTARTTTAEEWKTPFAATGGVIIANTGTITLNAAKVFNSSVPLTINSGATLATGNFQLTFGGNFVNNGTFTGGSGAIVIANTMVTQSVDSFTTTGLVSMTKTAGTATLQGNVNGNGLTINGTGGTLNLGTELTHTFTGTLTRTNGTLNGGSSTLKLGAGFSGTGGTFTAGTGTVEWNKAGAQTLAAVTYNNLVLSGSGAKTITTGITVGANLSISGTATATLANGSNTTANSFTLGGVNKASGTWGSTSSTATHKNSTYFPTVNTGVITVATGPAAASVTNITSTLADGSYTIGQVVPVTVTFSGNVNVTGIPQLTLSTGSPVTTVVNYSSGSGTPTLTFNYTVAVGNTSADLNYSSTSALALNGGMIKDDADNNTTLTLPATGTAGSLGTNKAIIIDTAEPSSTPQTPAPSYYNAGNWPGTITGTASDTSGINKVEISISDGTNYWNGADWSGPQAWFVTTGTTSWSYSFTPDKDVELTISSRATDNAGNAESTGVLSGVFYDTTAPGVPGTPSTTSPTNNSTTQNWSWTDAVETLSGIQTYFYRITGSFVQPLTSTASNVASFITSLGEGIYNFFVTAQDNAGNTGPESSGGSLTVDTTAPNTTIDSGPSGFVSSTDASFTFSADETSIFECDLDGGGYSSCTSSKSYSGLSEGSHTFDVKATDTAGNPDLTPASQTWTVDTVAPVLSSKTDFPNSWYTTDQTSIFTYTDATSSIVSGIPVTCDITTEGVSQTCSVTPSVCDAAGNCNTTLITSNGANIDKTNPTGSITSPNSGDYVKGTITINATASDSTGSGVSKVEFYHNPPTPTYIGQDASDPYSFAWDTTGVDDGSHSIYIKVFDNAGNDSGFISIPVTVDNTTPGISFVQNVDLGPTQNDAVVISVSDSNPDSSTYYYGFYGDSSCADVNYNQAFASGVAFNFNDENHNGEYICVRAADLAGNNSYAHSTNPLNIDITPPQLTSAETRDVDNDGNIDAIKLTFNENINDSMLTSGADGWDVADPAGAESIETGDTANDNILLLSFGQGQTPDTGNTPTVTYTATGGLASTHDTAGNELSSGSWSTTDGALPVLLSSETKDINGNGQIDAVKLIFSEDIKDSLLNTTSNDGWDVTGYNGEIISTGSVDNDNILQLNFNESGTSDTGNTPMVSYIAGGTESTHDMANNQLLTTALASIDTAAPIMSISPAAGNYDSDQLATLSTSESTNIFYTIDGSIPDDTKTVYSGNISVDHDMTIKAIAYDNAGNQSDILTATYGVPPKISSESSTGVTDSSAFISWTTDDPSTSKVVYDTVSHPTLGAAPNYGYANSTVEDSTKVTFHLVTILNLGQTSTFYYRTVSHGSPEAVGDEKSFSTGVKTLTGTVSGASTAPSCSDQKPASAPSGLSAVAGTNSVTLTWSEASDPVSYYLVTYGTSPGSQTYGNPNVGGLGTTSYTITGLSGRTTYYFKVRAGNGCAPGEYSSEASATPTGGFIQGIAPGFAPGVLGEATESAELTGEIPTPTTTVINVGQVKGLKTVLKNKVFVFGLPIAFILLLIALFLKKRKKIIS